MRKSIFTALTIVMILAISVGIASCGATPTPEPTTAPAPTEAVEVPPTEAPAPTEAAAPTEAPEETEPVILRVGVLQDIDCWNPYACAGVWFWGHIVLEGFTEHGPASTGCEATPRLAESWEVSDDGLTWTIKLHEGITFSDGSPADAQAIVDFITWQWNDPEMQVWFAELVSMESIEALDDLTIQYTTFDPILNSPDYDWQWWYILPPDYWTEISGEDVYLEEYYPPIGTGPYVVTEHEPGSHIILDAREDYYRGKPPIDRVVLQQYTNADALVNALLAGEIDLTTPWLPPEVYDTLANGQNITVEQKPPGRWSELVFNMHPEGIKHPAIDDPAVREAIDYAIDKEQLVEVALLGQGVTCPTNWGCGPNFEGEMNPDLVVTPFDLAKANQILDEAGYLDTDNDGIRETPDGEPLIFRLFYQSETATDLTMAEMIGSTLQEAGIGLEVEGQEWGTWMSFVLDERDFDLAIDTETHDIDPASMDFWFSCWSADSGSAALNYPGWCDEEMEALVYEFWYSTDPEGRWEPMFKAQEILNQERPIINLAGHNSIQAYRNDRFEFPMDTCDVDFGMFSSHGLLNATVK